MIDDTNKIPDNTGDNRNERGQWKPGTSGNPNGKPPGSLSLIALLKSELREKIKSSTGEEMEIARALMKKLVRHALSEEDIRGIKEILDRVEGKSREQIDIEGGAEFTLNIVKHYDGGDKDNPSVPETEQGD